MKLMKGAPSTVRQPVPPIQDVIPPLSPSSMPSIEGSGVFVRTPLVRTPHLVGLLWQNHLDEGFVARINLSDSQRSENTINTHKYNTIYW
jgi:hypothetical protein